MFSKVSNTEIFNRINALDAKFEVLLLRLDTLQIEGCCDCRTRETKVYRELKEYIQSKVCEFEDKIVSKIDGVSVDSLKSIVEEYRQALLNNLEHTDDRVIDVSSIQETNRVQTASLTTLKNVVDSFERKTEKTLTEIGKKVDAMLYDNEIIRHQIIIEQEVQKCMDDINNLQLKVEETLKRVQQKIDKKLNST